MINTINEAAARAGADVILDVLQRAPSAATDEAHPTAVMLAQSITEVEGHAPKFEMCPGVSETR